MCCHDGEFLLEWRPPSSLSHTPGEITVFFCDSAVETFLVSLFKCHRVQRWQPQVHFSQMWSVDRKRFLVNLAVSPAYWYSVTFAFQLVFFLFFFHPIFIRAWFLQPIKYIVTFLDIFDFANCNYFAIPLLVVAKETVWNFRGQVGLPSRAGNLNKTFLLSDWTKKNKTRSCFCDKLSYRMTHTSFQSSTAAALCGHPPVSYWIFRSVQWERSLFLNIAGGECNAAWNPGS